MEKRMSAFTRERLPVYLAYLRALLRAQDETAHVSATSIAAALGLGDVLVRKDLAAVSGAGRPKTGYAAKGLAEDIERRLGMRPLCDAVLVGAGEFGRAALAYDGYAAFGLNVAMVFDSDKSRIGERVGGRCVLSLSLLEELCAGLRPRAGIIAAAEGEAQTVCDRLARCGVKAVWNLTPAALKAPEGVLVIDEDLGASLRALSRGAARRT